MSDYKKFELIKLNIGQSISEIKSYIEERKLYWLDRLLQRIPAKNFGYDDLAPESDIKNGKEYLNALYWGVKNKNVKNIALTGPYGSGKSSIIQTYLRKYPSTKALNISLATFNLQNSNNDDFENEIELGILKQLFYKVDSDKIPQSRYRKIKKQYYKTYFGIITGFVTIVFLAIAFYVPDIMENIMNVIVNSSNYYEMKEITSYLITGIFVFLGIALLAYIMKWGTSKFRVKELNIADKATVADEKDESSIFDKSMDELVYFFEATEYDVVFIEDLDRFDSTKIFVKLRELNTILNNYDLIKRKIVFVYAIKDDMFNNEERTKFFDFIIPVIPIINSTNSGEILREKLKVEKQVDGSYRSSLYNISSSYITLVSPFIEDMRVLTNICNEFIIYKNTLKSVKLNDEKMFSMMIFKSLYPREFSELEAEKGIVKQAFEDKKSFIKEKQSEIEKERDELEKILNDIEKDILKSVKEVKAAFLNYLIDVDGPFHYCNINGKTYYYRDIMQDKFDMNKFKGIDRIRIYNNNNSYRESWKDITGLNNNKFVKDYLSRMEYLKNNEEFRKEEMRKKIEDCNDRVSELQIYPLKTLIEKFGSEAVFSDKVKENKFLVFLLRKGYINENYADYINYFHPNSITKEEMNFVRGVRMQEAFGGFLYPIRNVEQVCERIEDYEFGQAEALNFDIVDYLITKQINSRKCTELFNGLAKGEDEFYRFIKEYIERKKNIDKFINILCKFWTQFWDKILNDEILTEDKKFEYLALILKFADIKDIIILDENSYVEIHYECIGVENEIENKKNAIKRFVENNRHALPKLSSVSKEKMINIINALDIYFNDIDVNGSDKEVLSYIFENNIYDLNIQMLHSLFEFYFSDKIDMLKTANYTVIRDVDYKPLMESLSDINEFATYVSEIVIGQDTNIDESIDAVEDILERLFDKKISLCKEILDKVNVVWESITECCKCSADKKEERKLLWDYVLTKGKIKESWDNFIEYYMEYGFTEVLIKWIDNVINQLLRGNRIEELTDEIIKEIITQNISIYSFDKLTQVYKVEEFDCNLLEFGSEQIAILIKNKYILYNSKYINDIYQVAPEQVSNYLIYNKEEFIQDIVEIVLKATTIVELLRSGYFQENEINKILESGTVSDMNREMAIEIRKLEVLVKKEYVERAWELLEDRERYQLLLNQLENYSNKEISLKLATLAPEYQKLSDCSKKHREYLSIDSYGYNKKLLKKLKAVDYLSSVKISEYNEVHNKGKKQQFEVWIRKQ